ncbi:MAG: c-type cytochrome [Actinomycetota bacterium]|nr:c-type cytochrome [Actinomycetota bacterium]
MRVQWTTRSVLGLILGLIPLALAVQIALSLGDAAASGNETARGQMLYEQSCMSCHGADAGGTADGPSLHAVGAAAVNFMLSTGRMPLADPSKQPVRQPPAFSPGDIASIVAYVQLIAPGGPGIPAVDPAAGNLAQGQEVFAGNCAACHGAGAGGDAIGGGQSAPSLYQADPTQIAEAIRLGPGQMPRFDQHQLSEQQVNSVVAYVGYLQRDTNRGGFGLGRLGPVAEGFVAAVVGLGTIVLVIRFTGTRS